jgi:hypothetical protein
MLTGSLPFRQEFQLPCSELITFVWASVSRALSIPELKLRLIEEAAKKTYVREPLLIIEPSTSENKILVLPGHEHGWFAEIK